MSVPGPRPLVIGLCGGIGSGKSEVAGVLRDLGCVVADSDAQAREALRVPRVREQLVAWWGSGVLDPRGEIDRSRVASIVFAAPAERARLESLLHPMVRAGRHALLERAGRDGAIALVIDAPLLHEAAVDRECDWIIFVDAPREVRLERVRRSRGWDEAELARREASQLTPDDKMRRSDFVVANVGDPADLRTRVEAVLAEIRCRGPRAPR
ncbi:MAG: dephospho-CoA kinase [Phycisphaerae bacterium]|nr:dephospho-CoA kinase [Phycisphaerae bacterium]